MAEKKFPNQKTTQSVLRAMKNLSKQAPTNMFSTEADKPGVRGGFKRAPGRKK